MRLLRLKITDPAGFRSLPPFFEHHFRTEWTLQDEAASRDAGFAPFVCAGPNGSGKSNLLEALAAIFFQLEVQRVRRSFLPDALASLNDLGSPRAFELDYLIKLPPELLPADAKQREARVRVSKAAGVSPQLFWANAADFPELSDGLPADGNAGERERDFLLPQYVLGYSSGENEILSLPFFKLRFVQFDEYWNALAQQQSYPGRPETRLAYLDNGFSQAILLCNLLFEDEAALQPFREDVGVNALKQFRIVIRRSFTVPDEIANSFGEHNPALNIDELSGYGRINLMYGLEASDATAKSEHSSYVNFGNFDPIVTRLKRCATLSFHDEETDTLILDYWVNEATKQAFRDNFDNSPLALYHAFQVLLALNLYSVSDTLKADLYRSSSHYVSETVPTLASDQRIMRFKHVYFTKQGVQGKMLLKELSDGEHQLLHSLGLCLLFRNTNSLFLLDEPETHFNPEWRANFISRLRQCLPAQGNVGQEMLITTHTPFLISDSRPEKVLVFGKDKANGTVSIRHPDYNTLGASINKITMNTFGKRETIGAHAQKKLHEFRDRFESGSEDALTLIGEVDRELGDSVEKILLIRALLDKADGSQGGNG
ncbi:restriction system-associated AAA family ATPase [Burkholderia cenocepacia]|uniref:restriction system-associated AAA family ATPase n=1 Tax=Burkholderia cenocepacia TaxID=95486 RepID=UPI000F5A6773|nr:restriction system-associated AAA family ATPase [Burkholderia cenocepacia]MBR8512386.1 restriction system-associated AAA family ATPase [Burkholderia cenocepacia]RQV56477.1 ABC transporter [Burkholderia cenocepacia]